MSNQTEYKARNYRFKQYKTKACKTCPVRSECTTSKVNGKVIQRSEVIILLKKKNLKDTGRWFGFPIKDFIKRYFKAVFVSSKTVLLKCTIR
nr:transposase [uncultured Brumimicrobium sp.]